MSICSGTVSVLRSWCIKCPGAPRSAVTAGRHDHPAGIYSKCSSAWLVSLSVLNSFQISEFGQVKIIVKNVGLERFSVISTSTNTMQNETFSCMFPAGNSAGQHLGKTKVLIGICKYKYQYMINTYMDADCENWGFYGEDNSKTVVMLDEESYYGTAIVVYRLL